MTMWVPAEASLLFALVVDVDQLKAMCTGPLREDAAGSACAMAVLFAFR